MEVLIINLVEGASSRQSRRTVCADQRGVPNRGRWNALAIHGERGVALAEGQTGATFTIRLACGWRRAKEGTMIDAREHVTMTTVGAVVGAALGAAIGGAALGLPGAVAGMMLCALGGGVFGSFM
jgi:outer membrane lipoprotein SlyB